MLPDNNHMENGCQVSEQSRIKNLTAKTPRLPPWSKDAPLRVSVTHWEELFEVWAEQELLRPQPGLAPGRGWTVLKLGPQRAPGRSGSMGPAPRTEGDRSPGFPMPLAKVTLAWAQLRQSSGCQKSQWQ